MVFWSGETSFFPSFLLSEQQEAKASPKKRAPKKKGGTESELMIILRDASYQSKVEMEINFRRSVLLPLYF